MRNCRASAHTAEVIHFLQAHRTACASASPTAVSAMMHSCRIVRTRRAASSQRRASSSPRRFISFNDQFKFQVGIVYAPCVVELGPATPGGEDSPRWRGLRSCMAMDPALFEAAPPDVGCSQNTASSRRHAKLNGMDIYVLCLLVVLVGCYLFTCLCILHKM